MITEIQEKFIRHVIAEFKRIDNEYLYCNVFCIHDNNICYMIETWICAFERIINNNEYPDSDGDRMLLNHILKNKFVVCCQGKYPMRHQSFKVIMNHNFTSLN